MKASTSKGKGKSWGSLTKQPKSETTEGPSSGESHSSLTPSKFCGPTKGNKDLPIDRSAGVKMGAYAGT